HVEFRRAIGDSIAINGPHAAITVVVGSAVSSARVDTDTGRAEMQVGRGSNKLRVGGNAARAASETTTSGVVPDVGVAQVEFGKGIATAAVSRTRISGCLKER